MKKMTMITMLSLGLCLATPVISGEAPSYAFVQSSAQGTIHHLQGKSYQLIIKQPPQQVVYFSDRPKRQAGNLSLKKFIQLWSDKNSKESFAKVSPNVAVTVVDSKGKEKQFVAELTTPSQKDSELHYTLLSLNGQKVPTGDFKSILLFIDDIHWNPGGFGN